MKIADVLKKERQEKGLSQSKLAKKNRNITTGILPI